jgi:hypothetical protein
MTSQLNDEEEKDEARAFAELISYMKISADEDKTLFPLTELHQLYTDRLHDFGIEKSINKTRFKARILGQFPGDIQEQNDGKHVLLVFNQSMKSILKDELARHDYESEALTLAKAADIIRRDIFSQSGFHFNGSFPKDCQTSSVPSSLRTLVSMLLNGLNISNQDTIVSQPTLTISQLVVFNVKKKSSSKASSASKGRHSLEQEPPLPLYIGLNIHSLTRSKKIITQLYNLGMSVPYDRVDDLSSSLASAVCNQFEEEGVVCPLNLRHGIFTVGALDNIDHNPSSTTAQGSFHGTGISLFQFPTSTDSVTSRHAITLPERSSREFSLPESYNTIPAVGDKTSVPQKFQKQVFEGQLTGSIAQEECWAQHAVSKLNNELTKEDALSWSAYHASLNRSQAMLPVTLGCCRFFMKKHLH